jgi:hypothetical protein
MLLRERYYNLMIKNKQFEIHETSRIFTFSDIPTRKLQSTAYLRIGKVVKLWGGGRVVGGGWGQAVSCKRIERSSSFIYS